MHSPERTRAYLEALADTVEGVSPETAAAIRAETDDEIRLEKADRRTHRRHADVIRAVTYNNATADTYREAKIYDEPKPHTNPESAAQQFRAALLKLRYGPEYNGWTNRETWSAALFLLEDPSDEDRRAIKADRDHLKECARELTGLYEIEGLAADMLGCALDTVDWDALNAAALDGWADEGDDE